MRYRLTNAEGETVLMADTLHRIYRFLDHAPREPYTLYDNGQDVGILIP